MTTFREAFDFSHTQGIAKEAEASWKVLFNKAVNNVSQDMVLVLDANNRRTDQAGGASIRQAEA